MTEQQSQARPANDTDGGGRELCSQRDGFDQW